MTQAIDAPEAIDPAIPANFTLMADFLWQALTGSILGSSPEKYEISREAFIKNVAGAMHVASVAAIQKQSDLHA